MTSYRNALRRAALVAGVGAIFGTSTVVAGTGVGAVFNLGSTNVVHKTTTLAGSFDGAQLSISNPAASPSAAGLSIGVAAGHAPIKVNSTAGKALNLNADKLDGLDSAQLAKGTNVTVLSARDVLTSGQGDVYGVTLLVLPGLGRLDAHCSADTPNEGGVYYVNTSSTAVDLWENLFQPGLKWRTVEPGDAVVVVASDSGALFGGTMVVGRGDAPGPRRTLSMQLAVVRPVDGGPCTMQATGTTWTTP